MNHTTNITKNGTLNTALIFTRLQAGGLDPPVSFSKGFFEVAAAQNPKPQTLAIIAGDAEFPRNAAEGARKNAKDAGLKVVYDKTYPPTTTRSEERRVGKEGRSRWS